MRFKIRAEHPDGKFDETDWLENNESYASVMLRINRERMPDSNVSIIYEEDLIDWQALFETIIL